MYTLKQLSQASVPGAMAKVERYRLLNEPAEAESICRDILEIDPESQPVLIAMVLCLSDQIPEDVSAASRALEVAAQLKEPYDRAYYSGIVWERKAKAHLHKGAYGSQHTVHDWMVHALRLFEEAEQLRPAGNDDAILRWNACVRFLTNHPEVTPRPAEAVAAIMSE
jgi:hypothetical protein